MKGRKWETRHIERRLLRFGFDVLKSWKNFKILSETRQRECPVDVLYTCLNYAVQPVECPYAICWVAVYAGVLYISAWGFGVARFDRMGNFQEPQNVERATMQGFTLFLCLYVKWY